VTLSVSDAQRTDLEAFTLQQRSRGVGIQPPAEEDDGYRHHG
jgi:hypothetical protein